MGVFTLGDTDWDQLTREFQKWVNDQPGEGSTKVLSIRPASSGSGFSNESHLAVLERQGARERIIIRTGPASGSPNFFPDFDLYRQFRVTQTLHDRSNLPVPSCSWYEENPALFGSPFYVMEFIEGEIPSDMPLHTTAGFMVDASDEERGVLWWSTIEALARVATLDWRSAGLEFLDAGAADGRRSLRLARYWADYFRWATDDEPPSDFEEAERIRQWLFDNAPEHEPVGLIWGDSRFGNIIYREYRPAALLDWEMATIGNPECDLAYFLFHEAMNVIGNNNPQDVRPRLGGFPGHRETIERYEDLTGRPATNLPYYWVLNGYKVISLGQRAYSFMQRTGMLSRDEVAAMRKLPVLTDWVFRAIDGEFPQV